MASNDNNKRKVEEEAKSSMVRMKTLWHSDNDDGDDSSD
jgi:hypothetical protein